MEEQMAKLTHRLRRAKEKRSITREDMQSLFNNRNEMHKALGERLQNMEFHMFARNVIATTRCSTGIRLGARLYTLYVRHMSEICKRHDIHYHSYADDTQLYVHYDRNCDISMREAITKLEYCITEIGEWMTHNCSIKPNQDKTEECDLQECNINCR